MPVKTNTHHKKKAYPKHYVKVYWPYLPLALVVGAGLWLGHPATESTQNGQLVYQSKLTSSSLLAATNKLRLANHQRPLAQNAQLTAVATTKASDMVKQNYLGLFSPGGQPTWSLATNGGYAYQKLGENLAYGFTSADQAISAWSTNPSHRANLLDPSYSQIGLATQTTANFMDKGPQTVIVALYGAPVGATTTRTNLTTGLATSLTTPSQAVSQAAIGVNKAQLLTGGQLPWIGLALAVLGIAGLAYVVLKHSLRLRRSLRRGERYIMKHPILDLTIVAFAALCALLCQTVGAIR